MVAIPIQDKSTQRYSRLSPGSKRRPILTARWVRENGKLTCKWLSSIR